MFLSIVLLLLETSSSLVVLLKTMPVMIMVGVRSNWELTNISITFIFLKIALLFRLSTSWWPPEAVDVEEKHGFSDHSHYCGSEVTADSHSVARLCCLLAQTQTQTLHFKTINVESLCQAQAAVAAALPLWWLPAIPDFVSRLPGRISGVTWGAKIADRPLEIKYLVFLCPLSPHMQQGRQI